MINFILFGSFFILLLLNAPIAVSLGLSSVLAFPIFLNIGEESTTS